MGWGNGSSIDEGKRVKKTSDGKAIIHHLPQADQYSVILQEMTAL